MWRLTGSPVGVASAFGFRVTGCDVPSPYSQ